MKQVTEQVVKEFVKGNEMAFDIIFNSYYKLLVIYARRLLGATADAEDVVMDSFTTLWERRNEISHHKSLNAFLYKVVYNRSVDSIRKNNSRENYLRTAPGNEVELPDFETSRDQIEEIEILYSAIESLPDQCQRVFNMNKFEGKKYREIAEELSISIKTVENHMGKALKILREHLLASRNKKD